MMKQEADFDSEKQIYLIQDIGRRHAGPVRPNTFPVCVVLIGERPSYNDVRKIK